MQRFGTPREGDAPLHGGGGGNVLVRALGTLWVGTGSEGLSTVRVCFWERRDHTTPLALCPTNFRTHARIDELNEDLTCDGA